MAYPSAVDYVAFPSFEDWARDVSVAEDTWTHYFEALENERSQASPEVLDQVLQVALRSAALETGAIEGLYSTSRGVTMTVAAQGVMWEAELERLGADVRGHFEAQLEAFEMVLDAATHARPVNEPWLRSLHASVCAEQKTYRAVTEHGVQEVAFPHGTYKTSPNHVLLPNGSMHWYAPVEDTAPEVNRLVDELRRPRFLDAHPVIQAAYAHHAFTSIHPFADGNGRTARALAAVYLYRGAGIPLVVFADQQEMYFDALAAADEGAPQSFVRFIEDRAVDTMAMVSDRLREARTGLVVRGQRLRELLESHGGLSHAEVQAVGRRLFDTISQRLTSTFETLRVEAQLPVDIAISMLPRADRIDSNFGGRPFHPLQYGGLVTVTLSLAEPVSVIAETTPVVGIAQERNARFAFIAIDANRPDSEPLYMRVNDLHPAITASAEARIEAFVRRCLDEALDAVLRGLEQGLRRSGLT